MAVVDVTSSPSMRLNFDWDEPVGVATPELAATWGRLEIMIGHERVTSVEDLHGNLKRSVHTSAYPLAEWIAFNWWQLVSEIRYSTVAKRFWSWTWVSQESWLRNHNFRGAGGGMAWPDMTLVPEGNVCQLQWRAGPGLAGQPVRFITSGHATVSTDHVVESLSDFVERVIDKLVEAGIYKTPLQSEWLEIRSADESESEYLATVARLGIDPYSIPDELEESILAVAEVYPPELLGELFDGVSPERLAESLRWLADAREASKRLFGGQGLTVDRSVLRAAATGDRPWSRGYALARAVRAAIGLTPTDYLDIAKFVPTANLPAEVGAVHGYVSSRADSVSLILAHSSSVPTAERFQQSRALGLSIYSSLSEHVLTSAKTEVAKLAGAFAAELLAPAEGLAIIVPQASERHDESLLDVAGTHFGVSATVIERQLENQLTW